MPAAANREFEEEGPSDPLLDSNAVGISQDTGQHESDQYEPSTPRTQPLVNEQTGTKYSRVTLAALMLVLALTSFVIQTETASYIQKELGWNKAYCMMYLTHGSWATLWPLQILAIKGWNRSLSVKKIVRSQIRHLQSTVDMILSDNGSPKPEHLTPFYYLIKCVALVTCALTVAGSTWYIAVNLTTPSDLTAIYNCSAFFAYAFSIPILHEKPRLDKIASVLLATLGVIIVAYGDGGVDGPGIGEDTRLGGNILIGIGSVLYGLYEVLYKRLLCPPESASPGRIIVFSNTICASIGAFTLLVCWLPLPVLHWTGLEVLEMPRGETATLLMVSIAANAVFSGSFLLLISLTGPVLSSVAALLTIFLVAVVDRVLFGNELTGAAITGGLLIVSAFALLSWATWTEISENTKKRPGGSANDN